MADSGSDKSLHQLEHEAELRRAALTETVDALRERVSPETIKEDVRTYVRETREHMLETIERRAKENPLQAIAIGAGLAYPAIRLLTAIPAPMLLIGAGIALSGPLGRAMRGSGDRNQFDHDWGQPSGSWQDSAGNWRNAAGELIERAQSGMADAREAAMGSARNAAGSVSDMAAGMQQTVTDTMNRATSTATETMNKAAAAASASMEAVTSTVSHALDEAKQRASRLAETASETMSSAMHRGQDAAGHASEQFDHMQRVARQTVAETFERHPLVVGGVGLAIGAAIAAALPVTEVENRALGGTSEDLRNRAKDLASRGYEAGVSAAREVYDDVGRVIEEEGLTTAAAQEVVSEVKSKVKDVASRAVGMEQRSGEGSSDQSSSGQSSSGQSSSGQRPSAQGQSSNRSQQDA